MDTMRITRATDKNLYARGERVLVLEDLVVHGGLLVEPQNGHCGKQHDVGAMPADKLNHGHTGAANSKALSGREDGALDDLSR